jgi:NhaP-type Na+/H+ or K+/H+ antiporter
MLAYLGILMLVGLACGALTGVAASAVMRHLRAVSWRAPRSASRGILPVVLAVLLIAGGLFLAWREMHSVQTATVTITTDSNISIQNADQPPF